MVDRNADIILKRTVGIISLVSIVGLDRIGNG
jgi:hypothetical protein